MTRLALLTRLRPANIYLQVVVASLMTVLGIVAILVISTGRGPIDLLRGTWGVLLVQFALTVVACSAVYFAGAWIGRRRRTNQQA